ncbi:FabD/lysophospholipase-like protein [Aaosphaeria arxii CBS 175.79]|uniref:FabD/lysophospholipase-like protein n=1 Tax=Aaosphaeria arxii CBS 175.79 TaxID=1450172 RepID=A0A6A5XID5_9PLEO|nr:FabD/lysophospholipase-like protein [Aaosphaeria arxii CBS 175.79]KAF2012074.1 FabD/lysophospholipase-like protein [Aaosphaeria arxii CBS 175.79]
MAPVRPVATSPNPPKSPRLELSNVETNPNAPLRLLSLDGGGVRGLSSLMVLDDLMENIALEEKRLGRRAQNDHSTLKPCDYFDLIGGTSTGGIIAILLSRLRLDCKQCIGIYTKLAEEIFKHDKSIKLFGTKVPTGSTRFSGAVLERAIRTALVDLGYPEDEVMWDDTLFEEVAETDLPGSNIWTNAPPTLSESPTATMKHGDSAMPTSNVADDQVISPVNPFADPIKRPTRTDTWKMRPRGSVHKRADQRGCRGFVVSSLKNALGLPRLLTTYDPNDRKTRIWEALRATSAAPTFFEEMQFGTPKVTYLDGGVGFNNPCAEVDYAAKALWEGRAIGIIVSVGTGLQSIPSVKKMASWLPFGLGTNIALASALAGMATGTARVDNEMKRMYYNTSTRYYRFDVDRGLADISLEQWMKEDEMVSLTQEYMSDAKQLRSARQFGELMAKLSSLPPKFEIGASHFRVGIDGKGLVNHDFEQVKVDFKTGLPLGMKSHLEDYQRLPQFRENSPSGEGGLAVDKKGKLRTIFPVAEDLDGDGRRQEAAVYQCMKADNICLRSVKTGIPPGRYRVQFIVSLHNSNETTPADIVFSVGKPFDTSTFTQRYVDVKITPDIVPVLLYPDAVRVRVGRTRYADKKGKGWIEIEGDVEVNVGLAGALGFIISKKYEEGVFVDGWTFGGVRLEPIFAKPSQ